MVFIHKKLNQIFCINLLVDTNLVHWKDILYYTICLNESGNITLRMLILTTYTNVLGVKTTTEKCFKVLQQYDWRKSITSEAILTEKYEPKLNTHMPYD